MKPIKIIVILDESAKVLSKSAAEYGLESNIKIDIELSPKKNENIIAINNDIPTSTNINPANTTKNLEKD